MINLDIKNDDSSLGLKRGLHYGPAITMKAKRTIGVLKQSDNTTDADGYLYPTGLNDHYNLGNIQTFLNSHVSLIGTLGLPEDSAIFTNNQKKVSVADTWFGKYNTLISAKVPGALRWRQTLKDNTGGGWVSSNSYPIGMVEIDSTKAIFFSQYQSGGVYAFVVTRDANNLITVTDPVAVPSTSNAYYYKDNCETILINSGKFLLVFSSNNIMMAGTISGTTLTFGTAINIDASYSSSVLQASKIDLDRALITYRDNSARIKVVALTVSGTTITLGTAVQIVASGEYPWSGMNTLTEAFVTFRDNSTAKTRGVIVSIAGNVCTVNTAADISLTGFMYSKTYFIGKIATNKFMFITREDKKVWIATISGTSFSLNSSAYTEALISNTPYGGNVEITAGSTYHLYECDGTSTWVRRLNVSGTAVTVDAMEACTRDQDTTTTGRYYWGQIYVAKWGTDFTILTLANAYYDYLSIYFGTTGPLTAGIYSDATLIGSIAPIYNFSARSYVISGIASGKRLYLGIKNTSGGTRSFVIEELTVNVK